MSAELREQYLGSGEPKASKSASKVVHVLPHSLDAEMGVLGSMMLAYRDVIPVVVDKARESYFYLPAHCVIFRVLVELWNAQSAIDSLIVTQKLRDMNLLETVGGVSYVMSIFTFVPATSNVGYYLEILREKYVLREIMAVTQEMLRRAVEEQDEADALLDELQCKVTSIALDSVDDSPVKHVGPAVLKVIEEFENNYKHRGRTTGMPTGFADLDRMTMGLHPGEMTLIGARPSMGKTALAMNIVEHVAVDRYNGGKLESKGQPVLIFSIETGVVRLMRRSVCARARLNLQSMKMGLTSEADLSTARNVGTEFYASPIHVDDSPSLRLPEFRARCRRYVAQLGIKLVVVDYGQLMRAPSKRAEFSKALEIADVSQGIKEIGRELNVAMLVLAQLNRDTENSRDPRPKMSNLRESGQLEQDADHIWLLHRPEYYLPEGSEDREKVAGQAELIIAKQKDGRCGTIQLRFIGEHTRFEGVTSKFLSNNPNERQGHLEEDF